MYFIHRTTDTRALPQIFRLFWIPPKNPYLKQATPRNTCQIFLPKKSPNWKVQTQKLLRSPLSLEIRSSPPPPSPGLLLTISSRIVDRQDDTNGETEDNDCINKKMLLKNYILQCVYTTLQSNVLIRDSYENKDPWKQALGFMWKQKRIKGKSTKGLLHCEAILRKRHSIKLQYFQQETLKQWQIQKGKKHLPSILTGITKNRK